MGPGGGWELCGAKLGDAGMSAVTHPQRPPEMLMGGDTCHPRGPQNQGLVKSSARMLPTWGRCCHLCGLLRARGLGHQMDSWGVLDESGIVSFPPRLSAPGEGRAPGSGPSSHPGRSGLVKAARV